MFILRDLLKSLQNVFPDTDNGRERFVWFDYTVVAILVLVTSARSSNLGSLAESMGSRRGILKENSVNE